MRCNDLILLWEAKACLRYLELFLRHDCLFHWNLGGLEARFTFGLRSRLLFLLNCSTFFHQVCFMSFEIVVDSRHEDARGVRVY